MKDLIGIGVAFFCFFAQSGHSKDFTPAPERLRNPRAIALGAYHACALDDEEVKYWGKNADGQAPALVKDLKNPRAITAGNFHTCALDDEGVKCWGKNADGQAPALAKDLKNPKIGRAYV